MKLAEVEIEIESLVENAIIEEPEMPAARLVESVIRRISGEARHELSKMLIERHVRKLIVSQRRAMTREENEQQWPLFEDWPDLPRHVRTEHGTGSRTPLAQATLTDLRTQLAFLKRYPPKKQKQIAQLEALIETMEKYARTHKGITVQEVASLEAR